MQHQLQFNFSDDHFTKRYQFSGASGAYQVFELKQKGFHLFSCNYRMMQDETIEFTLSEPTVIICLDETMIFNSNEQPSITIGKNQCIILKVSTVYSLLLRRFKPFRFFAISFEIDKLKGKWKSEAIVQAALELLFESEIFLPEAIPVKPQSSGLIASILDAEVGSENKLPLHGQVYELIKAVIWQYKSGEEENNKLTWDRKMHEAKDFITDNFLLYDTELLFEKAGINSTLLVKKFKTAFAITPLQHYRKLQLEKAYSLVINTRLPMKQIADTIGFTSASIFIQRFKEAYGKTPKMYRKYTGRKPKKDASIDLSR